MDPHNRVLTKEDDGVELEDGVEAAFIYKGHRYELPGLDLVDMEYIEEKLRSKKAANLDGKKIIAEAIAGCREKDASPQEMEIIFAAAIQAQTTFQQVSPFESLTYVSASTEGRLLSIQHRMQRQHPEREWTKDDSVAIAQILAEEENRRAKAADAIQRQAAQDKAFSKAMNAAGVDVPTPRADTKKKRASRKKALKRKKK